MTLRRTDGTVLASFGAMVSVLCLLGAAAFAQDISGDEILRRMESTLFPDNYRARISMVTVEPTGREREIEFTVDYKRGTGSYTEVLSPPRSRGMRFLQRDDALWMFIPRSGAGTAIRLSGRDSFQGSVFSNRDIGESMYTEDYRAAAVRRETMPHDELGRVEVFVVEAVPRHDEAAYGKIESWVTVDEFIPLRVRYFVRAGMNTKEMMLSEITESAGRRRPVRMEMVSHEERGQKSIVRILELEPDDALADRIFTQRHLTR